MTDKNSVLKILTLKGKWTTQLHNYHGRKKIISCTEEAKFSQAVSIKEISYLEFPSGRPTDTMSFTKYQQQFKGRYSP